jgi:hypothetical protein
VDHVAGWQPIALGEFRVAGRASAQGATLLQQLRPGGAMDCAIDTPSAKERSIRCIDDAIDRQRRYVSLQCPENGWHFGGLTFDMSGRPHAHSVNQVRNRVLQKGTSVRET